VGKAVFFKGEEEFSKEMPEIAEKLRDALNLMARQCGDLA
jgi:hypothetical protein